MLRISWIIWFQLANVRGSLTISSPLAFAEGLFYFYLYSCGEGRRGFLFKEKVFLKILWYNETESFKN